MLLYLFAAVVALALFFALRRLRRDDGVVRRMKREEYTPLVKHIWWH